MWRGIRELLHGAVAQALARIVVGLLALFGVASGVDPGVPAALHQAVVGQPSGS
ncbi:MAG: hypothetical protein [Arizlama microvirus]|nr:MAG: hypothetical protein [Arizlama microvirus]